jgi:hypothetical protein
LPESYSILMTVLKQLLEHRIIYLQRFVKKNHITKSPIFGVSAVFSMRWSP